MSVSPSIILFLLLLGFYPYLLYPLLVAMAAKVWGREVEKADGEHSVTVIIAAYNEQDSIEATVRNKLEQDYPSKLLDVIVMSDESTDDTDEIVRRLAEETGRVALHRQEPRQGKTAALNTAVRLTGSDIVVFSDANSIYDSSAIRELTRNFSDPTTGYVSGHLNYVNDDMTTVSGGSSAYMKYENRLREYETRLCSIVGVDGGVDAVRRELYSEMRPDHLPDFVLPLSVVRAGYRVVYEPGAISHEKSLSEVGDEFRMRVRVTTRALWALIENADLANPLQYGLFSWQLVSHKWLRYLSVLPLGAAWFLAISSMSESMLALMVAGGGALLLVAAGAAAVSRRVSRRLIVCRLCHYFLVLNLAQVVAMLNILKGERFVTWQPRGG